MSGSWTTADYALLVSLFSMTISLLGLGWNIWSKFIYPKPKLEVSLGYYVDGDPEAKGTMHMINVTVTNHGPITATVYLLIGRKAKWHSMLTRRFEPFIIKHWGKTSSRLPAAQLPKKLEVGEQVTVHFPPDMEWLKEPKGKSIGAVDTFGNKHWAKQKDLVRARESQKKFQT